MLVDNKNYMIEFPKKIECFYNDLKCQMLEQNQNCTRQYVNSVKESDSSVSLLCKVIKILNYLFIWPYD